MLLHNTPPHEAVQGFVDTTPKVVHVHIVYPDMVATLVALINPQNPLSRSDGHTAVGATIEDMLLVHEGEHKMPEFPGVTVKLVNPEILHILDGIIPIQEN